MTSNADYTTLLGAILELFEVFLGYAICGGLASSMWGTLPVVCQQFFFFFFAFVYEVRYRSREGGEWKRWTSQQPLFTNDQARHCLS